MTKAGEVDRDIDARDSIHLDDISGLLRVQLQHVSNGAQSWLSIDDGPDGRTSRFQ